MLHSDIQSLCPSSYPSSSSQKMHRFITRVCGPGQYLAIQANHVKRWDWSHCVWEAIMIRHFVHIRGDCYHSDQNDWTVLHQTKLRQVDENWLGLILKLDSFKCNFFFLWWMKLNSRPVFVWGRANFNYFVWKSLPWFFCMDIICWEC